jgi:hypothetical protein
VFGGVGGSGFFLGGSGFGGIGTTAGGCWGAGFAGTWEVTVSSWVAVSKDTTGATVTIFGVAKAVPVVVEVTADVWSDCEVVLRTVLVCVDCGLVSVMVTLTVVVTHPPGHGHEVSRFRGGCWLVAGAVGELPDRVSVVLAVRIVGKLLLVGSEVTALLNGIVVVADTRTLGPDLGS